MAVCLPTPNHEATALAGTEGEAVATDTLAVLLPGMCCCVPSRNVCVSAKQQDALARFVADSLKRCA